LDNDRRNIRAVSVSMKAVFTKLLRRDFSMARAGYQCRRSALEFLGARRASVIKIKDMKIFWFPYFGFLATSQSLPLLRHHARRL